METKEKSLTEKLKPSFNEEDNSYIIKFIDDTKNNIFRHDILVLNCHYRTGVMLNILNNIGADHYSYISNDLSKNIFNDNIKLLVIRDTDLSFYSKERLQAILEQFSKNIIAATESIEKIKESLSWMGDDLKILKPNTVTSLTAEDYRLLAITNRPVLINKLTEYIRQVIIKNIIEAAKKGHLEFVLTITPTELERNSIPTFSDISIFLGSVRKVTNNIIDKISEDEQFSSEKFFINVIEYESCTTSTRLEVYF